MENEQTKIPLGTQLKIWGKLSTILAIAFLSYHGAIVVKDKAHWGAQANASERTVKQSLTVEPDYIDSKAVAVPQDLEPIKIELTDSEKAGLAKCKKTKPVSYCNGLWGV